MIHPNKIIQRLRDSADIIDLILLILSSGIGLALVHHLAYPIKWTQSGLFVLWIIFFYLGSEFFNNYLNQNLSEGDFSFRFYLTNIFRLLAVLFFSLSVIPLVQILITSLNNYLVIYLMCIMGLWFLMKNFLVNLIQVFGVSEIISSFVISFIAPLVILNINEIRIHEILFPIVFFVFLEIIAFKFISEMVRMVEKTYKVAGSPSHIGYFTLLRTISILIPFGYLSGFFLLFSQGKYQLLKPLLITIPLAALIVIKIARYHGNQSGLARIIKLLAIIFVLLIETAWILGLWVC
ncbi:MAG: hypothetical protein Q8N39_09230 [Pelolinea sp.]|nr:hypothetical protein [Pelolinea sp.]